MNGSSIQLFIANKNCKKRQHTVILQWYCFTLAFFAFVSVNFTSTSPSLWCAAKLLISQMGSPESCKIIRALYNYMRIFFYIFGHDFIKPARGEQNQTNNLPTIIIIIMLELLRVGVRNYWSSYAKYLVQKCVFV
jgi:hypothetical protein